MSSSSDAAYVMNAEEVAVPPAAGAWQGSCPADPAGMAAFFAEQGFLVLRGVIGRDDLAGLDRELERIARDHRSLPRVREGFNVEDPARWPAPDRPVFRKIGGIYDLSPDFRRLCHHPRIVDALAHVCAADIDLYRDVVMMKQAGVGREKPWHQDGVYWPYRPFNQVSALTALDRMGSENGGLQVVPGSHRRGPLEHGGTELQVTLSPEDQAATVYVPLEPGDTLLFHSLLLHGSEPNRSPRHRRVVIFSYMDAHLDYVGRGPEGARIPVRRAGTAA